MNNLRAKELPTSIQLAFLIKKKIKILSSIDEIPKGSNIALYGAGGLGKKAYKLIKNNRKDIHVTCFIDTFKEEFLEDLPVIHISQYLSERNPDDLILITSYLCLDIVEKLASLNICNYAVLLLKSWEIFIIDEWKLIYLVNNKVAYSSIANGLCHAIGASFNSRWDSGVHRILLEWDKSAYKDYFIFSFVRNPFDRLVSCYEHFFNRPHSSFESKYYVEPISTLLNMKYGAVRFDAFVRFVLDQDVLVSDRHWRPQYDLLSNENDMLIPNEIGRFENIHDDFQRMSKRIGKTINLPHTNKANKRHKHYQNYYSQELWDAVEKHYLKDIDRFEY